MPKQQTNASGSKLSKLIGIVLPLAFIAAWILLSLADNTYVNYGRTPDPVSGRVVPYAVKGVVVYISQQEQMLVSALGWIVWSAGIAIAVVLIGQGRNPFRKPGR